MKELRDAFVRFWEVITGVLNDNQARIIRILCFAALLIGMFWAVWNYFRASSLSDEDAVNPDIELEMRAQTLSASRENETLKKIAETARMIGAMRQGGEAIAASMTGMNRRLFNLDDLEDISGTGIPVEAPVRQQEVQPVSVRAIMLSNKTRLAVVDAGGKKGIIIRQGQELPNGIGRVVRIKSDGLIVRNKDTKQEVEYSIK